MIFVAGTDTGVGKTLISAILMKALNAHYWKPVQAGMEPETDTESVQHLTGLPDTFFLPETYKLKTPASPHYAAEVEQVRIDAGKLQLPAVDLPLIIEGAGGLMVPLNQQWLFIDLIEQWQIPVVLVAGYYLGAINHTLLSIEALNHRKLTIAGVVFNGDWPAHAENFIRTAHSGLHFAKIPKTDCADVNFVEKQSTDLRKTPFYQNVKDYADRKR